MSRLILIMITIAITAALHAGFIQPGSGSSAIKYNNLSEETTTSSNDNDKFPDICLNIKVQIFDAAQNVVKISWTPPSNEDTLILARSNSIPIRNREIFLNADKSVDIQAGRSSYLDKGLEPGSYYYAILSKRKSRTNQVLLYSEENYNSHPIVISKFKNKTNNKIVNKKTPPKVSLIRAQFVADRKVRVSWKGVKGQKVIYTLYRGSSALSTVEKINQAKQVATISDRSEFFIDTIPGPGIYYYALTTKSITGDENKKLVADQSYTTKGLRYTVVDLPVVSNLKAENKGDGIVELTWLDIQTPQSQNLAYLIYRSGRRITTKSELKEFATRLGIVKPGTQYFRDSVPPTRIFYYSVVTQNEYGQTSSKYESGNNTTIMNMNDNQEDEEPSLFDHDRIQPKKVEKNKFQPVDIPVNIPVNIAVDINAIIRSTYLKGNYHRTIAGLQNYKSSPNEKLRAKALFYTGLSHYKLRNYDEAIQYFVNPLVMRAYKKSANFWYKRTLGKIR